MRTIVKMLAFVVGIILFTGCTYVQRGAAIGAGAGAAVGGFWAPQVGTLTAAQGAMIGAAGGGLVGALVGDGLENMSRQDLENEIANLKRQLAEKDRMLGEKDKKISDQDKMISDQQAEIDRLKKRIAELEARTGETRTREVLAEYTLEGSVLFKSGSAELTKLGQETLDKLADDLKKDYPGRKVNVEGHTDNVPIKSSQWKSNWELGAGRALAVLHYLKAKGIEEEKFTATTYSEFTPKADNGTKEGRSENRRVVIVVVK